MCVVSMLGDFYHEKWDDWKKYIPNPPTTTSIVYELPISRTEFEQLKKEVEDMKELLKRAKIYDEQNNEPNCEIEQKLETLRAIAKLVGIDLDDVLKPKQ